MGSALRESREGLLRLQHDVSTVCVGNHVGCDVWLGSAVWSASTSCQRHAPAIENPRLKFGDVITLLLSLTLLFKLAIYK